MNKQMSTKLFPWQVSLNRYVSFYKITNVKILKELHRAFYCAYTSGSNYMFAKLNKEIFLTPVNSAIEKATVSDICDTCDGTGEVPIDSSMADVECPDCDGTGKVPNVPL